MPPPERSAAQSAADTLAAAERYQLHVHKLAGRWLDAELYHTVSRDIEDVRRGCQQLPSLSAAWIALLIAHAELMHALWHASKSDARSGQAERERLLERVDACVRRIQDGCMGPPGAGGRV